MPYGYAIEYYSNGQWLLDRVVKTEKLARRAVDKGVTVNTAPGERGPALTRAVELEVGTFSNNLYPTTTT